MPPPSALAIKTSSVIRLVKEEASYHKEAAQQKAQVEKLEADGADEYELRQPVRLSSSSGDSSLHVLTL
jgi:tubulin-specific chaperone A